MLFAASVTHTLPPGAPWRHVPRCCRCLVTENHSLLKPLSYFQFFSPGVTQAHLQLVWLTSRCVGARVCECEAAPGEVCGLPVKRGAAPPPPSTTFSQGVTRLRQTACGVSLLASFQVEATARLLPHKHLVVQGCFCGSRPQWLLADVCGFFFSCLSMYLPPLLPLWCFMFLFVDLLHWFVEKPANPILSGFCPWTSPCSSDHPRLDLLEVAASQGS